MMQFHELAFMGRLASSIRRRDLIRDLMFCQIRVKKTPRQTWGPEGLHYGTVLCRVGQARRHHGAGVLCLEHNPMCQNLFRKLLKKHSIVKIIAFCS